MKKMVTILLCLCLLSAELTVARDSNSDWALLQSISPEQLVLVKTPSGKSLKGQFRRATDSVFELVVEGKSVQLQPAEISRVYVLRGRQILKWTLIGTGVGTGAGAGIGAIAGRDSGNGWLDFGPGFYAAVGAALGLVAGSITGLVIGSSHRKKVLVYEAAGNR